MKAHRRGRWLAAGCTSLLIALLLNILRMKAMIPDNVLVHVLIFMLYGASFLCFFLSLVRPRTNH